MKLVHVSVVACLAIASSVGCSSSNPLTNKDAAAKIYGAGASLQQIGGQISSAASSGGTSTMSKDGLHLDDVAKMASGSCPGGGTFSASFTANTTGTAGGGSASGSGSYTFTASFTDCKVGQDTYNSTGFTYGLDASGSSSMSGGTTTASGTVTFSMDGAIKVAGAHPMDLSCTAFKMNATYSASVTNTGTGAASGSASVNVTANGSCSIDGSSHTFNNETYSVSEAQ